MKVSVVIPVFNAQDFLSESVAKLLAMRSQLDFDCEIYLRDDGSTDKSAEILRELSQKQGAVHCSFNPRNVGLGETLRSLWQEAAGDIIVYLDADLPFGTEALLPLVRAMRYADIAVASRYRGTKNSVALLRRIISYGYYFFCKMLFRIKVRDIGSGAVAIRKDSLKKFACTASGFVIHIELLAKAQRAGLTIEEIPLPSWVTPPGTFRILRHGFIVTKGTWQLYKEMQASL